MRSFLGLCNVYRRFSPKSARVASPFNKLLRKGQAFYLPELTPEQQESFELLKHSLTEPPVLHLPRNDLPYSVDADACEHQIGCALLQTHPDNIRYPIGFWSRFLTPAERNYSVGEKEYLAVVWATQMLRPDLEQENFNFYTDHEALKWVLSSSDSTGRLARWRLRLVQHYFTVGYKKGAKNQIADAISRLPTYGESEFKGDLDIPCFIVQETLPAGNPQSNPSETPTDEGRAGLVSAMCNTTSAAMLFLVAMIVGLIINSIFKVSLGSFKILVNVHNKYLFPSFPTRTPVPGGHGFSRESVTSPDGSGLR